MLKNVLFVGIGVVLTLAVLAGVGFAFAQTPTPPNPNFPYGMMGGRGGMMGGYGGGWGGMMGGWGNNSGQTTGTYGPMHEYMTKAFAEGLGITDEELDAQLAKGQSMWQVAQAKGLTQTQFYDLMVKSRNAAFKQMVADGLLTQQQADWMSSRMNTMMGGYGGFGSGYGCMGGFGGPFTPAPAPTQPAS